MQSACGCVVTLYPCKNTGSAERLPSCSFYLSCLFCLSPACSNRLNSQRSCQLRPPFAEVTTHIPEPPQSSRYPQAHLSGIGGPVPVLRLPRIACPSCPAQGS